MDGNAKILVIDDDPDIHFICQTVLEQNGYTVVSAMTGADGRACLQAEQPDLVILDIMMEEADTGFALAEEIGSSVPILMLSSIAAASEQIFDISRFPIGELVEKPIATKALLEKVDRLLKRSRNK